MNEWAREVPPTQQGVTGCAWKVDVSKLEHTTPDTTATLSLWLVNSPGVHPLWEWWVVSAIHLRPIEGQSRAAHVRVPGATHEVLVAALDPDRPVPDPRTLQSKDLYALAPLDVMEQFTVPSDAEAAQLCDLAAEACCKGTLFPDQDFRRMWNVHVQATAKHFRDGTHRTTS